jgi:hypothetical protein
MNPITRYGGIVASIVLIAFGIGSVVTGLGARSEVRDSLKQEQIVGTPDMDASIANKPVDTGAKAKLFAEGMRRHTLKATGDLTYSQMGHYLTAAGKPTDSEKAAAIDPKSGKPVENAARNIWVTETALTTALNTSFFAESVARFATVMGAALLLVGIGFLVLIMRGWQTASATETRRRKIAKTTVAAA